MRTILEIGGFVETINNQDGAGGKFTVAQAGVPQVGFWSRPEFRIFATYLNDAENDNAFAEGKQRNECRHTSGSLVVSRPF